MNINLQFRNRLARRQGITHLETTSLIANRARSIATEADCVFMGLNKHGATFCVVVHVPDSTLTPYRLFSWETVMDTPGEIIEWAQETRQRCVSRVVAMNT